MLVRNDVSNDIHQLTGYGNGRLDIQALKIYWNIGDDIVVVNVYNSGGTITLHEFNHYFSQCENNCIVVGNFNVHHRNWNTRHNRYCSTGQNLVSATAQNHLNQLTYANMPTYISNTNGTIFTLIYVSYQLTYLRGEK